MPVVPYSVRNSFIEKFQAPKSALHVIYAVILIPWIEGSPVCRLLGLCNNAVGWLPLDALIDFALWPRMSHFAACVQQPQYVSQM